MSSFTLVPPGPVSDKIEVELRLSVWNDTREPQSFKVTFLLDEDSESNIIHSETVSVQPGESCLVSHWWPSAGHLGNRKILYRARLGKELIDQGEWPLEVLPSETQALPWSQGMWLDMSSLLGSVYPQKRYPTPEDIRDIVDAVQAIGATTS